MRPFKVLNPSRKRNHPSVQAPHAYSVCKLMLCVSDESIMSMQTLPATNYKRGGQEKEERFSGALEAGLTLPSLTETSIKCRPGFLRQTADASSST